MTKGRCDIVIEAPKEIKIEEDCYCDSRAEDISKWLMGHTDNRGGVYYLHFGKGA